jgi:hypothetical protein
MTTTLLLIRACIAWWLFLLGDLAWRAYQKLMPWSAAAQGDDYRFGPWCEGSDWSDE